MTISYNELALRGTFLGGQEVWSVNPKFWSDDNTPLSAYADLLQWAQLVAAANDGAVLPTNLLNVMSSQTRITEVVASYYGSDGKLAERAIVEAGTAAVGAQSPTKPLQVSIVASLITDRPGRSYRGRIYWPALSAVIGTGNLRLSTTDAQAIATATAEWLEFVGSVSPIVATVMPVVVSQIRSARTIVYRVGVGDVLDTQRRRRDTLNESYAYASILA